MAGQLTIDTLKASSGVLATQNGMTGIAKAWVQFNGTTNTINGAFNIGSITKNGAGDYTLNFTTAMANGNYSMVGSTQYYLSPTYSGWQTVYNMAAPTTSACRIGTGSSASGTDCNWVNVAIFGA